jgi:AcrR family transcriptional regulator
MARPVEDRTTTARIRDTAVHVFGRDGFAVPLRALAAEAGVSHGLVVHHFGSKDGLRQACDDQVLRVLRESKARTVAGGDAVAMLQQLAAVDGFRPVARYVVRSLQAGGPVAAHFVEQVVADAASYLAAGVDSGVVRPSRDPAARARYLAHQALGGMLLRVTVEPALLDDDFAGLRRISEETAGPGLELLTEGLFTDRSLLDAYLAQAPDPPARPRARPR